MKRIALVGFLASLGAILLVQPARARQEFVGQPLRRTMAVVGTPESFRADQVLVQFRDTVTEREASSLLRAVRAREARPARHARHFRVTLETETPVLETVRRLRGMPEVQYAEPNHVRRAFQASTFTPNDRLFRLQWNFRLIGAPRAWAIQKGKADVAVAVLDTGIAYEDFGPYRKAPDWGSQQFLPGWDFVNGDAHPNDDESHGTHVASTIAQATNNGLGVAGLAFDCSLMPVKVLDERGGGSDFDIAEALDYVTNFREGGKNPVRVINMSFGGGGFGETLAAAVDRAAQAGILLVGSSGNDDVGEVVFPASLENVVAVGAVDGRKQRAYYTSYGSALDLVAPGGDDSRDDDGDGVEDFVFQQTFDPGTALGGRYDAFVTLGFIGTSSSSPHVAALAALLFSQGIGDAHAVRAVMEQTAEDLGATGRDDQFGHGLIRPEKALSGLGLAK